MKITVQFEVPDHTVEEVGKVKTMRSVAEGIIQEAINRDSRLSSARVLSLKDDKGVTFCEVNIDVYGVLRVIGGISFEDSTGQRYDMLVVDEGACYLLFELQRDCALFHGALSGMELERFEATHHGWYFSYYNRKYQKLGMKVVGDLISHNIQYKYEPASPIESARKSAKRG